MFVPLWALIPGAVLAALALAAVLVLLHVSMRDAGRHLFGRHDAYLDNHVREERWYVLYVCIHVSIGCHSYSSL
jgi:hypothetical protein